jgi:hypothetical protein
MTQQENGYEFETVRQAVADILRYCEDNKLPFSSASFACFEAGITILHYMRIPKEMQGEFIIKCYDFFEKYLKEVQDYDRENNNEK